MYLCKSPKTSKFLRYYRKVESVAIDDNNTFLDNPDKKLYPKEPLLKADNDRYSETMNCSRRY